MPRMSCTLLLHYSLGYGPVFASALGAHPLIKEFGNAMYVQESHNSRKALFAENHRTVLASRLREVVAS